jgi:hypothetical protein
MRLFLGGPVFHGELLRTARRRRYYVLRFLYGLALLCLITYEFGILYGDVARSNSNGVLYITDVTDFANRAFYSFIGIQLVTLLACVPAVVGGVIADEKQRKTLHYLMASLVPSSEIVLDKLGARMLLVGVFIALGIPILCLLNLLGGVSWQEVAIAYSVTIVAVLFAASLAVFASTIARRVKQAVVLTYLLLAAWFVAPPIAIGVFALYVELPMGIWMQAFQSWIPMVSPFILWGMEYELFHPPVFIPPAARVELYIGSMVIQVVLSLLLLLYSMVLLRPIFRRQEGTVARSTWFRFERRRPRWLAPPPCGADAMLWKERYYTRTDVFTKMVVLPATIVLVVFTVLAAGIDESLIHGLRGLFEGGFGGRTLVDDRFNAQLRLMTPYYVGLWLLAVAGASASCITMERERDTWVSLTSTPLTGAQILRAKMLGAIWGLRGFGVLIALFWVGGLLVGGVHPLGFVLSLATLAILTWFVAALGAYQSLRAAWTSRALTTTLLTVLLVNAGMAILVGIASHFAQDLQTSHALVPNLPAAAFLSFRDVGMLMESVKRAGFLHLAAIQPTLFCIGSIVAYAAAAFFITRKAVTRFDAIVDRPRLEAPIDGQPFKRRLASPPVRQPERDRSLVDSSMT